MKEKLISVVIPMYNCEEYMDRVLGSLLAQTYRSIEIVCVVDGATDATLAKVMAYAELHHSIKVISQTRSGAGVARNTGLAAARGEYVLFLDADDLYPERFLEKMVETADRTQADITVCQYLMQDGPSGQSSENNGFDRMAIKGGVLSPDNIPCLFSSVSPVPHNKLYRRSFILGHGLCFSKTASMNDVFFSDTSLASAERIAFIDENLYTYRFNHSQKTISAHRWRHRYDLFSVFEELYQFLQQQGVADAYSEAFCRKWKDACLYYLGFGRDDDAYIKAIARYLSTQKPFCDLPDKELARRAGLYAAWIQLYALFVSKKDKRTRQICANRVYNIVQIRAELAAGWGKKLKPREPFLVGVAWKLREYGLLRAIRRLAAGYGW